MVSSKVKNRNLRDIDFIDPPPQNPGTRDHRSPGHDDVRTTLIGMAIAVIMFKVVTSVMIIWFFPSWQAVALVVALNTLWFVPVLYYVPRHAHIRYRLWNVRLRRKQLLAEEWRMDND